MLRFGRLRLAAAAALVVAVAAVWLVGDLAMAVQTLVILGAVLAVALIQRRQTRSLNQKVDQLRRATLGGLSLGLADLDLAHSPRAAGEIPQEHFDRLAGLLAANNQRLETAIDDLSDRLSMVSGDDTSVVNDDRV